MDNYDLILEDADKFKDYFLSDESEPISYFPKFSTINIIVGANNSGKSRFMRNLMNFGSFVGIHDIKFVEKEIEEYNLKIPSFDENLQHRINYYGSLLNNRSSEEYVSDIISHTDKLKRSKLIKLNFFESNEVLSRIAKNKQRINRVKDLEVENSYFENYANIPDDFRKVFTDIKRYYIPTLRTAHSLFKLDGERYQKIESDVYLETLNNYYGLDKVKVEVFTGMHLYKDILNTRNSKREIRESFENFEAFISKYFFEGKRIDIVAEFNKDESLKGNNHLEIISVHIEGEKDTRNLYRLGDGIQAIIILMYKIFMAEPDSFIFIDEPELNLHPGMQRLFLEQICSNPDLKKKNLTYIISTHSNHFLDLTIEKENVSIYSFSPKNNDLNDKQFVIKNVNRGDNNLLRELGVNNSSVFMANCSIWVEGISDRNYIKAFLKSYCNSKKGVYPKEDIDFAFFEYAGSNIDHYLFGDTNDKEEPILEDIKALALSNRIFLLADSDAAAPASKKGKRLESLESSKSDNFIPKVIYDFREIENLITNDMWKEILIDFCNERLVKENEESIQAKIEDALKKIDYSEYKNEYIGTFLNALREEIGKIGSTYILNKSLYETKKGDSFGTIINKRNLSEIVFDKQFPWEILSQNKEIETLTKEIYDFITSK